MKKIIFYDTKPYDTVWFDKKNTDYEILYQETKLNPYTARLARGCDAVCAFVNDDVGKETIDVLAEENIKIIAMRSAGYSNVDFKAAYGRVHIVRVPAYSPYAVAEHTMALLLTLNRKTHKAYNRTRDFNFSLVGFTGVDLHGKIIGVIGTGKIGRVFIDICRGFGLNIIAYDLYPQKESDICYVELEELFEKSDIISLHAPLTEQTKHLLNKEAFAKMKKGVFIINTSRGALIDSSALLDALNDEIVRGAGLDVYEEEEEFFFEDMSSVIIKDDVLSLLMSRPNVIITSHQAFLTEEALEKIAEVTIRNLNEFFYEDRELLTNEICYQCETGKVVENCKRNQCKRCF